MELREIVASIKEKVISVEDSRNTYKLPFPEETEIKGVETDSPSHTGPYTGAVDFIVDLETPISAPLDGRVIQVIDVHNKYGPSQDFEPYSNYVTIEHPNGEYTQLVHLKQSSAKVNVGDKVTAGQILASTGNSGWMTEPHLHVFVFKLISEEPKFKGVKIRLE